MNSFHENNIEDECMITGRYEEQFIEHRRNQLQAFVNAVCRHPVLSR